LRAQGDALPRLLGAVRGVTIAKTRAEAIEIEIDVLGKSLAKLDADNTLHAYVERRRDEVLSEARTTFLKDGSDR
jgi:hypothetical protein